MANPNSRGQQRDKPFRDALRMEAFADEADLPTVGKRSLRAVARALIEKGLSGDVTAAREIADRLDGKVPQGLVGDDDHDPIALRVIERVITDSKNSNSEGVPPATGASTV